MAFSWNSNASLFLGNILKNPTLKCIRSFVSNKGNSSKISWCIFSFILICISSFDLLQISSSTYLVCKTNRNVLLQILSS